MLKTIKRILYSFNNLHNPNYSMFKTKTHNAYIIIMINKESYIKKKSHKDSIRIVITHKDCGNIEILNNLWYNAISSINKNLIDSKGK